MSIQGLATSDDERQVADVQLTSRQWVADLSEYMDRVLSFVEEADEVVEVLVHEGSLGPIQLSFEEADAARRALAQAGETDGVTHGLLIAGVLAVCLKISEDVEDYRTAARIDPQLEKRVRSVLETDLVAAESLVADYAAPIDDAFARGNREEAVRLGELRLVVRQHMAHVRRSLAAHGFAEDPTTARESSDLGGPFPEVAPAVEEKPPDQLEESRRRYRKLKSERQLEQLQRVKLRKVKRLAIALTVALLVGAVGFAIQLLPAFKVPGPVKLTMTDFEGVPGVIDVLAKPPTLFVTVHGEHWDSLDRASRLRIVDRVGSIVLRAGYNDAVLTDPADTVVGEWISSDGSYVYPLPP